MSKKVYELANELEMGAVDLVEKLRSIGLNVRNHMVTLTDDELAQAQKELNVGAAPAKTAAKVVKKKVASKKVTKKVIRKSTSEPLEAQSESASQPDVTSVDSVIEKATTTVKKKKVAEADVAVENKIKAEEKKTVEAAPTSEVESTIAESPTENPSKVKRRSAAQKEEQKEVFKEKMHSFTPIFVPEESETQPKVKNLSSSTDEIVDGDIESEDEEDGKSKKRLGTLAAMVSKKGVAAKSKDITMLRAEEELKYATHLVGRAVYTPAKKKKIYSGPTKTTEITEVKDSKRVIVLHGGGRALEIAQKLSVKFQAFSNKCLSLNLLIKENDYIGIKLANKIAVLYDYRVEDRAFKEEEVLGTTKKVDKSNLPLRNPIITIMGHVDHGKTTLLDYIRKEKVAEGEAGGITQHIGAYSVKVDDSTLTFLDTPGHAAFAQMRQRGANVTDIVVLVVAADDGVMPQTKESIRFCQNANVPIIVAVNKMDKEGVNPDRVKQELMEFHLTPEDWGGDTQYAHISALKGDGVDNLLESIKLQAEMMDLRESDKGAAEGIVIESKIEAGRGPVATLLIQKGTLNKGDAIVVGETFGRARSLVDFSGKMLEKAGPSMPVQVLGITDTCSPGDQIYVVKNEREAKKIVDNRIAERKQLEAASAPKVRSLDDFFSDIQTEEKKVLNLIIRTDVHGSYEAIKNAVETLGNDEVSVAVIGGGVGAISDNDVLMATNSKGYIIGFNMRPVTSARKLAEQNGVQVKTYSIIYELIDDIKMALEGMLTPDVEEKYIGRAEVRDTFNIPKIGVIAGSAVIDGKIERGCKIRLLREGKIVYDGSLSSLKRFKDDVKEVKNGYECGISLENFNDIKVADIFEAYIMEEKKRSLESSTNIL
jgi:translation initiation factor IF-2